MNSNIKTLKSIAKQYPNASINLDKLNIVGKAKQPTIIDSITSKEQEIFKFFSPFSDCWFEGCKELREQYTKELNNLPENCPSCQKGSLIRKYKPEVERLLNDHNSKKG